MEAHGLLSETEHSSLYDQTYCARIVRASGSNFRAAFWCLSRAQRRGLNAVYAFCRFADDVVDSDAAETAKRQALDTWRNAVTDPAAAPHPILRELGWAAARFGVPLALCRELLDGVADDLAPRPIETAADMERYCYGVAGTVGLMCLRIFGVEETASVRAAALALANAFQLTNILRDCVEDARRGRWYLPMETCRRAGVTPALFAAADAASGAARERMRQCVRAEAERAAGYFAAAWARFPAAQADRLAPARVMSAYYRALLERIRRDPGRVLTERVRLPWWRKLQLVLTTR